MCGRLILNDALDVLIANGYDFSQLTTKSVSGQNRVRACNVFFAGADSGVWSYGLWPHRWVLSSAKSVGGGKYIYDYQITNIGTTASLRIGTFCHENGHMLLGYPDLYSYDGNAASVGNFSLMDGGNYGGSPRAPTPSTSIPTSRKPPARWTSSTSTVRASSAARCRWTAIGVSLQQPIQELRIFPFRGQGQHRLRRALWRANRERQSSAGSVAYHVYKTGTNTASTIFTASNPNCVYTKPYELMVVEANQKTTITPWYDDPTPDTADAFKSSGKSLISDATTPELKFWNTTTGRTTTSNCNIDSISADNDVMTFVAGSGSLGATPSIVLSRSSLNASATTGPTRRPRPSVSATVREGRSTTRSPITKRGFPVVRRLAR